ncbi:MAG: hypothetical protein PHU27_08515 [Salinivirgaceae bacterium]|nr:hypothetical protein [Salinivirgaceae bacterium]MDD4747981.1 hypothetical protein [Salinivirgaceae bacterium]MDY0280854.1 CpsB/CapC family capsule biosynthesis tyrosine phosphatase [Salinivirgaceae bacterium]
MLFWKKSKKPLRTDFSALEVDIHSHLIPGIDDGSPSIESSLEMMRRFVEMGYRKVITTPHVMSDYYQNDASTIKAGLNTLKRALVENNFPLEIEAAAEYYIDYDFKRKIDEKLPLLTFGDNYILVEISFLNPPESLSEILFELQTERYRPVLAHAERYIFWVNDFNRFEEMFDRGIKLQLNINSLTGAYGPEAQKLAYKLIDKEMYSFAGSDCHRIQHLDLMPKVLTNKHFNKLLNSGKLLNSTL